MSLHPGCWLEVQFKPVNAAAQRIEALAHDRVSGRARSVLVSRNIAFHVRNRLEDEIELASKKSR